MMVLQKSFMKFIKVLFFILLLHACQDDESIIVYSTECAVCADYQSQQFYMDTIVLVSLPQGNYCLGDTGYNYVLNQDTLFSSLIDEDLLNIMTQNGYCSFLVDTIIVN